MDRLLFDYIKLGVLILCSIIGVGFVSGAEIVRFFVKFGYFSYVAIIIFIFLFYILIIKIFNEIYNKENLNKMHILNINLPKNTFLIKFKIKSILSFINLNLMSSAMFAGLFSLTNNLLKYNNYLFCTIFILFIYFILLKGVKGLQKFDLIVVIFLMLMSIFLIFNVNYTEKFSFDFDTVNLKIFGGSIIFAVLYVFMNIVQIKPIIQEYKFNSKSNDLQFSPHCNYDNNHIVFNYKLFSGVLSLFIGALLLLFVVFLQKNQNLTHETMPFLAYFKTKSNFTFIAYVICLFLALMSSLISALFGVKRGVSSLLDNNLITTGVSIFIPLIISFWGFSNFVNFIYPFIGITNIIIFIFI